MRRSIPFLLMLIYIIVPVYQVHAAETTMINNISLQEVRDFLISQYSKNDLLLNVDTINYLEFEDTKPRSIDFTITWGEDAKVLHVYRLIEAADGVLLSFEIHVITNQDFPEESRHVLTSSKAGLYPEVYRDYFEVGERETQEIVSAIKSYFNGYYSFGFRVDDDIDDDGVRIVEVDPDLVNAQTPLLPGDKIVKINEMKVGDLTSAHIIELLAEAKEGEELLLTVRRGEKEKIVKAVKHYISPQYTPKTNTAEAETKGE